MKYTYLLIDLLTVFFPVVLSFDKRVQFYKSWKFLLPGIIITATVFLFWDVVFMQKGVWSFNKDYITGIKFFGLPVEEGLFFITVPFACTFIYACLNHYMQWQLEIRLVNIISGILILLSTLALLFYYDRLYTLITFSLLLVLLLILQHLLKVKWLNLFYRAYIISLIPFYIVNGLLTSIPIVLYNDAQNLGKRVGTIPVEDHFYLMALLLMNIAFFEHFKQRKQLT